MFVDVVGALSYRNSFRNFFHLLGSAVVPLEII